MSDINIVITDNPTNINVCETPINIYVNEVGVQGPAGSGSSFTFTGTFLTSGEAVELFYPLNSNPAGYLTNGDFSNFLSGINIGKTLYVDSIYGNDSTALKYRIDKPFASLHAAKNNANSGELIYVNPSNYNITGSLAKNGIDWYFTSPTNVLFSSDTSEEGIWDDLGQPMIFSVNGFANFTRGTFDDFASFSLIKSTNNSSNISINCQDVTVNGGSDGKVSTIRQEAGKLSVKFREMNINGGNSYGIWWFNGSMNVFGNNIIAEYCAFSSSCNNTPNGDAFLTIEEINAGGIPIANGGSNGVAAVWISSKTIKNTNSSSNCYSIDTNGLNKLYIHAQKLFGGIRSNQNAGLLYITADKISALIDGTQDSPSLFHSRVFNSGHSRISIGHWDINSYGGTTMRIEGGETDLENIDFIGNSLSSGIEIIGGLTRLNNFKINTVANNSANPIIKSSGELILRNCNLISNTGQNSIFSSIPQDVKIYGVSTTNTQPNSNVNLLVGTLIVDSNVN